MRLPARTGMGRNTPHCTGLMAALDRRAAGKMPGIAPLKVSMPSPVKTLKLGALAPGRKAQAHRRPRQYFGGGRQLPALVPDACVDMGLLASFEFLMQRRGQAVHRQQMRYDRVYALERITLGHAQRDAGLRQLSRVLWDVYGGDGELA